MTLVPVKDSAWFWDRNEKTCLWLENSGSKIVIEGDEGNVLEKTLPDDVRLYRLEPEKEEEKVTEKTVQPETSMYVRKQVGVCASYVKKILNENKFKNIGTKFHQDTGYIIHAELCDRQVKVPIEVIIAYDRAEEIPINTDTVESVLKDMLEFRDKLTSIHPKDAEKMNGQLAERIYALSAEIKEARQQKKALMSQECEGEKQNGG